MSKTSSRGNAEKIELFTTAGRLEGTIDEPHTVGAADRSTPCKKCLDVAACIERHQIMHGRVSLFKVSIVPRRAVGNRSR